MSESDPYKNLEEQLRAAVEHRASVATAPPPPRRRRRFTWPRGGAIPVLLGAVVLGGGVATAAVILKPASGDRTQDQIRQAYTAADRAFRALPACRPVPAAQPRMTSEPVPRWLSDHLEILRRPQTAADLASARTLRFAIGTSVLRDSIRVSRQPGGWTYRVFLTRGLGSGDERAQADPVGCARGMAAAANAAAARFPTAVQQQVRLNEDAMVAGTQRLASGRVLQFQTDEIDPQGRRRGGGGGGGVVPGGRLPTSFALGPYHHGHVRAHSLYEMVPDDVASARIVDTSGKPREKPVTVKVVDNFFHVLLPRRFGPRMVIEWRSASGHLIRTHNLGY